MSPTERANPLVSLGSSDSTAENRSCGWVEIISVFASWEPLLDEPFLIFPASLLSVRYQFKVDKPQVSTEVGCPPCKSGHSDELRQCPLYPQKRTLIEQVEMSALCQKRTYALQQKSSFYWITWAAVASNAVGTVRPRAFAVFRLITSWNLTGF